MKKLTFSAVLFVCVLAVPAWGADRYVDDDDVTCGGNSPCYGTINDAFAAVVVDGETIEVAAGTYSEHLDLDRPVDLIGAGASVTTIQSSNTSAEFLIRLGANVPITFSQGMVLEGFTLTGDLDGDSDLLMFRARVADENDPIIVRDNVFDCISNVEALKGIESRSGGDITNVVIENNQFVNECRYAIWLNSAINWLIQGNSFEDTWNSALQVNTSDVGQTHDIQILDNTFQNSTLRPDAGDFDVIYAQYFTAITLASVVYNAEVRGNSIDNSLLYSIAIADRGNPDLSNIVFECNDITNTALMALNELPATVIPAENNWWGAASGPTHSSNPSGTGDEVSDGFDFDPWLAAPAGPDCPSPAAVPFGSQGVLIGLGALLTALLAICLTRKLRAGLPAAVSRGV